MQTISSPFIVYYQNYSTPILLIQRYGDLEYIHVDRGGFRKILTNMSCNGTGLHCDPTSLGEKIEGHR